MVLTGKPGIGKTTVIIKIVNLLRGWNVSIGGFISKEVRDKGVRVGFEVIDLMSKRRGWLARVGIEGKLRLGRYTICLEDFEEVGVSALDDALNRQDVELVVVDEVGPMEMYSERFKSLVKILFGGVKPFVVTLHRRLVGGPFTPDNMELIEVTLENRNYIAGQIAEKAYKLIKGPLLPL